MTVVIRFIKLSNRWFADIPWDGDVADLEMVSGADMFLDAISNGNIIVEMHVSPEVLPDTKYTLYLEDVDDFGGSYKIMSYEYKGLVWICNVTKHVLGEFPPRIYISNVVVR